MSIKGHQPKHSLPSPCRQTPSAVRISTLPRRRQAEALQVLTSERLQLGFDAAKCLTPPGGSSALFAGCWEGAN